MPVYVWIGKERKKKFKKIFLFYYFLLLIFRQKNELINKFVDEVAEQVLSEVVEDDSPSICEEVFDEERRIKEKMDNEITKIREQLARNAIFK